MSFDTIASHLVYSSALNSSSSVVDGGAHKGWFSTAIANRFGCKCYAYELSEELFTALHSCDRVTYLRAALCGHVGDIAIAANLTGDHPMGAGLAHLGSGQETVAGLVCGLDFAAILKSAGGRVDLLKLDIEGAEIEFLDSATDEALAQVGQYTIEFHDHCGLTDPEEVQRIMSRFERLGYYRLWSSWRMNTHDMLFVNRRILTRNQYFLKMYPIRYWSAFGRMIRRQVSKLQEGKETS